MNGMRLLIVALLSLASLATSAQPFVGDEVLSDAMRPSNAALSGVVPPVSLAQDLQGAVMAWTARNAKGVNVLYVARLDPVGRIIAPVAEIPVGTADVEAYWPSIAVSPDRMGFTLAWIEFLRKPLSDSASAVYCRLDADLKPSARRVLATMQATKVTVPAIVRSGKSTWISFHSAVREIGSDGPIGLQLDAGVPVSDMIAAADFPKVVGQANRTANSCGYIPWLGYYPPCFNNVHDLRFVSLQAGLATRRLALRSDFWPAIQSDGRDVLVAWMNGEPGDGGTVSTVRLSATSFVRVDEDLQGGQDIGTFGPDVVATRPDIATDGERYVVVWSTKKPSGARDVVAAVIDRDGQVTRLSIAATDADERDPSILMTAPGNFLVAYETLSNGERRLATRTLKFNGRRRAGRSNRL